jgi:hypothetical protein
MRISIMLFWYVLIVGRGMCRKDVFIVINIPNKNAGSVMNSSLGVFTPHAPLRFNSQIKKSTPSNKPIIIYCNSEIRDT